MSHEFDFLYIGQILLIALVGAAAVVFMSIGISVVVFPQSVDCSQCLCMAVAK